MSLWGEDREFLLVAEPTMSEASHDRKDEHKSLSKHGDDGNKVEYLRAELQEAKSKIQILRETVSSLQTQVDEGKNHMKQMWHSNCRYVAEVD